MQKTGIVMQIKDGQAIVMTPEGQFLKTPLQDGMVIGQEVECFEVVQLAAKRAERSWLRGKWQQTGVIAASLLLAVGLWGSQSQLFTPTAYAYVTVDINPSIELSIDNDQEVVTATALNTDGEQVLAGLKLVGEPVDTAVQTFTEAAHSQGFLHDNSEVVVTASPAVEQEKWAESGLNLETIETGLVTTVQNATSRSDLHVEVEGILVSKDVRSASRDAGLSPGKYALYLMAQANGIDVSIDELKTQPISKIVEKRGTDLADVLHDLKGGEQLDDLLDTLKQEGETGLKQKGKPDTPPGQDKKQEQPNGKQDEGKNNDDKQQPQGSNNQETKKPDDKQPPGQDKKEEQPNKKDEKQGKKDDKSPASPSSANSTHKEKQDDHNDHKEDDKKGKGRD